MSTLRKRRARVQARPQSLEPLRPPAGAPNVLIVLLDDVGFGASSAFGGAIATPTAERLAAGGLKLTRFHTTAMCAPTRQALLTGRNHHTVGMGAITELATSAPGYSSVRPASCAPLAEILRLNGYSTAQFGKCHEVPTWQTSPMGPFDAWPTGGGGFEHFYGFLGGETNQYYPSLYEGTTPVEPPRDPGRGLPPDRGPGRPRHRLDPPAEGADARPPLLRLLRAGRHPRAASRAAGVVRPPPRPLRRRLGRPARGDPRAPEGAGGRAAGDRAHARHEGIPAWSEVPAELQARAGPPDGGLRRLPRAHRPPHRARHRRHRGAGGARGHARHLHHRRQRGERRGHAPGLVQRDAAT